MNHTAHDVRPTAARAAALLLTLAAAAAAAPQVQPTGTAKLPAAALPGPRSFRFTYHAELTDLPAGSRVRVWVPLAQDAADQQVRVVSRDLPAGATDVTTAVEPIHGNRMLSFVVAAPAAGTVPMTVPMTVVYHVVRQQAGAEPNPGNAGRGTAASDDRAADARVPVGGRSMSLVHQPLPTGAVARGRVLYDVVDDHMQYRKDKPGWGTGDAAWACASGFGNCTDFHSLFMSMARGSGLPARFEIGFPIAIGPAGEVAGYHCWAWFAAGPGRWLPVDIAEANQHPDERDADFGHLSANRVSFTTGRDIILTPKQAGPPLNFFVYPYAEVDGKPWPAERVKKTFAYAVGGVPNRVRPGQTWQSRMTPSVRFSGQDNTGLAGSPLPADAGRPGHASVLATQHTGVV